MSASSHQSLPLRKEVSPRGSVNSATGWIKRKDDNNYNEIYGNNEKSNVSVRNPTGGNQDVPAGEGVSGKVIRARYNSVCDKVAPRDA